MSLGTFGSNGLAMDCNHTYKVGSVAQWVGRWLVIIIIINLFGIKPNTNAKAM